MDSNVGKEQSQQKEELRSAETLYNEANSRLQIAIKLKNMIEMIVIQSLMDVACKKMESARKKLEECRKQQDVIGGKRRKVVENYFICSSKVRKVKSIQCQMFEN
jgi:hypothetical protein